MPFIAECLHCRGSRFQVPNKKRGTFGHCPKCNQEFLLEPKSDAARELVNYHFDPTADDDDDDAGPTSLPYISSQAELNTETAALTPETMTAPVVPPVRQEIVEAPTYRTTDELTHPATVGALVALGIFGFAILVSQLPYGRFVAGPIAVLGVAIAAFAWLGLEKRKWLGPLALGVNVLALLLIAVFPAWLGLSGWTPNADDPESQPKPVTAIGRDGSMPEAADVVDASKAVWQQGDVRIVINSAKIGPLDPTAKTPDKQKERAVRISVTLKNVGVARMIRFEGWKATPTEEVKLTQAGKLLTAHSTTTAQVAIFPGKAGECELVFAAPTGKEELQLELPASGFEGTAPAKFAIPRAFVTGR